MEINFVWERYKESIKQVLNYCFEVPQEFVESYINEDYTPENCLGCFENDRLAGLLHIYPYDMYFHGNTVPMGGIGLVSTLPQYRYYGCASKLLVKTIEIMKREVISFPLYRLLLMPFIGNMAGSWVLAIRGISFL